MSYTLVLSGLPGTGSFSFWHAFGFHPEIERSSEKEPATLFSYRIFVPTSDNYISHYYKITEKTKVLLDGSITPTTDYIKFLMTVKDINRICCVFRIRDLKQMILSQISSYTAAFFNNFIPRPEFLNEDYSINFDNLYFHILETVNQHTHIENVEKILGKNNILIVALHSFFENQKTILSFFGVDNNVSIERCCLNSTKNHFVSRDHFDMMCKVKEFVFNNSDKLDKVIKKSNMILHSKYKVIGAKRLNGKRSFSNS
jgi:hypothetical protein